jgi:hypothetical protein
MELITRKKGKPVPPDATQPDGEVREGLCDTYA